MKYLIDIKLKSLYKANYSTMNSSASIYIPRMSTNWTENDIKTIMFDYGIGSVSYVDFTPINKKPGFREDFDSVLMSAFIHFMDPYISADGNYHWSYRAPQIQPFWLKIANGESFKLQVTPSEYWICLKNKNPIQRTLMNIHQVVENGRHLENLIAQQDEEIKNLKETVECLSNKVQGIHNVVYQLVGGLFCQRTQKGIIHNHLKELGFNQQNSEQYTSESSWPTTREGNENSEKIKKMEEKIKSLENELRG